MAKLNSAPLYPVNLTGGGIPVNLVLNKTPEGRFQIARVNKPGGPQEGDFDVLKGSRKSAPLASMPARRSRRVSPVSSDHKAAPQPGAARERS